MTYRYLIIGGGMTAAAAVKSLRSADSGGSIGLVSSESDAPYKKPPLSKGLWHDTPEERIGLGTRELGAVHLLGRTAVALDVDSRVLRLADGETIGFERALIATGARARTLPNLPVGGPVVAYRTLADYHDVRARAAPGSRVLVVGGGFVGSELAAGLTRTGAEVHMVFPEANIGAARFPEELAEAVTSGYRERGVHVHSGATVTSATVRAADVDIELSDGTALVVDLVVLGVGTIANDELAAAAGLAVADGILVDSRLRVMREGETRDEGVDHVFAAGDVAVFPWPEPLTRGRIEHEDNAVAMGTHAGRQLAHSYRSGHQHSGEPAVLAPYTHLPFFYSDLFDDGYEAVGVLDTRLEMVADWQQGLAAGVIYYLDQNKVVGVLLWNTWGQVDAAREIVLANATVNRSDLLGRLKQ